MARSFVISWPAEQIPPTFFRCSFIRCQVRPAKHVCDGTNFEHRFLSAACTYLFVLCPLIPLLTLLQKQLIYLQSRLNTAVCFVTICCGFISCSGRLQTFNPYTSIFLPSSAKSSLLKVTRDTEGLLLALPTCSFHLFIVVGR